MVRSPTKLAFLLFRFRSIAPLAMATEFAATFASFCCCSLVASLACNHEWGGRGTPSSSPFSTSTRGSETAGLGRRHRRTSADESCASGSRTWCDSPICFPSLSTSSSSSFFNRYPPWWNCSLCLWRTWAWVFPCCRGADGVGGSRGQYWKRRRRRWWKKWHLSFFQGRS